MANVRGTILLRVIKVLRSQREQARAVLPQSVHKYLVERVNVVAWYPADDYYALVRGCVALSPASSSSYELLGIAAAHADLKGVYRSVLRDGDVWRTIKSLSLVWRDQYDTGQASAVLESRSEALVTVRDHEPGVRELCAMFTAYVKEAAILAGGREVRVVHGRCVQAGHSQCEWRVSWKGDEERHDG